MENKTDVDKLESINDELFTAFNPDEELWIVGGNKSVSGSGGTTGSGGDVSGDGDFDF